MAFEEAAEDGIGIGGAGGAEVSGLPVGLFDGLMTGLREGRVAEAYVVFARISDWNSSPTYVAEIDAEKLEKYAQYHKQKGEAGEFLDPWRPMWSPTLPLW